MKTYLLTTLALLSSHFLFAQSTGYAVRVGIVSDPGKLMPITLVSAEGRYMEDKMFQTLGDIDPVTKKEVPILAEALPETDYEQMTDQTIFTFTLRKGARWNDGSPVTAADVVFTFKAIKCKLIDGNVDGSYFENLKDIRFAPGDSSKLEMIWAGKNISYEYYSMEFPILPQYIYDPEKALDKFSLSDIDKNEEVKNDDKVKAFAAIFNNDSLSRLSKYMQGSGPYELSQRTSGHKVVLTKKKNWWGEKLQGAGYFFQAYPDTIAYFVYPQPKTMVQDMKDGKLDVISNFSTRTYINEIRSWPGFSTAFNFYTPPMLAYSYLGINMRNPKFSDVRVRQAIACLVDAQKILDSVNFGMGKRTIGPVSAEKKDAYNDKIVPYELNVEKAKALLKEAGWKARKGPVLQKKINGKKTELTIALSFPAGNDQRKEAAVIFKDDAAKAGIKVDLAPQEWPALLQHQNRQEFEMIYGAWSLNLNPDDPKQLFHTESSAIGGSNFVGFGNAESDALIDRIRTELDDKKRNALYKKFQELLHEQVPYVFLFSPAAKILVSKKFGEIQTFSTSPGFNPVGFRLQQ